MPALIDTFREVYARRAMVSAFRLEYRRRRSTGRIYMAEQLQAETLRYGRQRMLWDEEEHPRDGDGKFASEKGAKATTVTMPPKGTPGDDSEKRINNLKDWIDANPEGAEKLRTETANPYAFAVAANMAHMGTKKGDWAAVQLDEMKEVDDGKGGRVVVPIFDMPKGFGVAPTLYSGTGGQGACGLCGASIKHIFYLQNEGKKWTLGVGSECVTHFAEGESGNEMTKRHVKEVNRDFVSKVWDRLEKIKKKFHEGKLERFGYAPNYLNSIKEIEDKEGRIAAFALLKSVGFDRYSGLPTTDTIFAKPHTKRGGKITEYEESSDRKIANWVKKHGDKARDAIAKVDELLGDDKAVEQGIEKFQLAGILLRGFGEIRRI